MRAFDNQFDATSSCTDVGKVPATALYDFRNAFPTVVHEWMFCVLRALEKLWATRNVILASSQIFAY